MDNVNILCIINPLFFHEGQIYYIKKKEENLDQIKKCICLHTEYHEALFGYITDSKEHKYFSIYKFELENNDYNILSLKPSIL